MILHCTKGKKPWVFSFRKQYDHRVFFSARSVYRVIFSSTLGVVVERAQIDQNGQEVGWWEDVTRKIGAVRLTMPNGEYIFK